MHAWQGHDNTSTGMVSFARRVHHADMASLAKRLAKATRNAHVLTPADTHAHVCSNHTHTHTRARARARARAHTHTHKQHVGIAHVWSMQARARGQQLNAMHIFAYGGGGGGGMVANSSYK